MILLSNELIFAEGGRRYCFVHPDDPARCIKTLSKNGDPAKRRAEAVWYKRLRSLASFDDNIRELESFHQLDRHYEAVWDHFPRYYGIQPTTRGDGIVTDLIRDESGDVSKTVRQYVKTFGKTDELLAALDKFFNVLAGDHVVTRDILDHNIVVEETSAGLRIVMIDGFGSSEVLPFSRWFKSVAKKKVARKIERCRARYGF